MKTTSRYTKIFILLTVIFAVTVMAQGDNPYHNSIFVRNDATFHKALVGDNTGGAANIFAFTNEDGTARLTLDSAGNLTVAGSVIGVAPALTGLTALDSAAIAGMLRIGGVVNYNSRFTLKNTAVFPSLLQLFNSRSTSMFSVDSAGKAAAETLTVAGNTRLGGLAAYGSRLSIKNDAVNGQILSLYNSRNTSVFQVDSSGKTTADTLISNFNTRLGGLAAYGSRLSVENDATNTAVQTWYNSRNTALASVDSSGKFNTDTLTVDFNTRLGGLAAYDQRLSVKNDAVNTKVLNLYNSRNTSLFSVDSSGVPNATTAMRDTFAFVTTALTHAISIPGATGGDFYFISKRIISGTSTDPNVDSLAWAYMAKTDSLIILRPNSNIVSGAKGSWL